MFFCRRCLLRGSNLLSGCRRCLLFLLAAQGYYHGRHQQQTKYHSQKLLHFWPPPLRGPSKVSPKYWHSSTFPIWQKGAVRWESWVNHKSPSVPDGPLLTCLVSFFIAYRLNPRNYITSLSWKIAKCSPLILHWSLLARFYSRPPGDFVIDLKWISKPAYYLA